MRVVRACKTNDESTLRMAPVPRFCELATAVRAPLSRDAISIPLGGDPMGGCQRKGFILMRKSQRKVRKN